MYLPDQQKMAQAVARQFFLGAVNRVAAFNMDMFARLSILEGAAGVNPGTWLRRNARGFDDALEHFGPHLAGAWSTTNSQGIHDAALASAAKVLSSVPDMDGEDLLQKMMVNSTRPGGNDRGRLFYSIGKKLVSQADKLGAGSLLPRDSRILSTTSAWVRRSAIDELRSHNSKKTAPLSPTTQIQVQDLDTDKREALLLLALQSPGGPGREVRQIIDRLIGQSFPKSEASIVKVFLQKIANPRYRNPSEMRRMFKTFRPDRWFGQALKDVRRQMIEEMKISPQRLTNVLGSRAKKVFLFLRTKVSKNPVIQKIISDLADSIDLLEPGAARIGTEREYELTERQTPRDQFNILQEWLRQSLMDGDEERDAGESEEPGKSEDPGMKHLPVQHIPGSVGDGFERGEYLEWGHQMGPHAVHSPGAVELRLALRYLRAQLHKQADAQMDFWAWMGQKYPRVRNPNTNPNAKKDISSKTLKDYAGGGEHQPAAQRMVQQYLQQYEQLKEESKKQEGSKQDESKSVRSVGKNDLISGEGGNTVLLSDWAKGHIVGTHSKPGKGSVLNPEIKLDKIQEAIQKIPASFYEKGGGAFEMKVPNAGYDLVLKTSDIKKKYPNAREVVVEKEERGETVKVKGYVVDNNLQDFATDSLTVVVRPTTEDSRKFLPEELQDNEDMDKAIKGGKAQSVLTAWAGNPDVPQASKWGDEYGVIIPNGGKGADLSESAQKTLKKPTSLKQDKAKAFDTWLGDEDPKLLDQWKKKDPGATKVVLKKYQEHQTRKPLHSQQQEEKAREGRFDKWLGDQGDSAKGAWEGDDRIKRIKVRQQFAKQDNAQAQKSREEQSAKQEKAKAKKVVPRKKLFSIPKDKKAPKWVDSDDGNRFHTHSEVGDHAKINDSRISGTVGGSPTIEKSTIQGTVGDKADVTKSTVEKDALVEGDSRLSRVHVKGNTRVRGDTDLNNATITGGSWDGQEIKDGRGGEFRNAYDQDVLDALTSIPKRGMGDRPLRAMATYIADGGQTKGWFGIGGELDRKKLQKKIKKHVYDRYDQKSPGLGSGASVLSNFDDDQFKLVWDAAEKEAEDMKSKRDKKGSQEMNQRMLYQLTKAALQHATLRSELVPLVRMAQNARVASENMDLRKAIIRVAYEAPNAELRQVLVGIAGTIKMGHAKQADAERGKDKYPPKFLQYVTDRKFPNPNSQTSRTYPEVAFFTPDASHGGEEWRTKIYEEWRQRRQNWDQDHMPQGLGPETKLDAKSFDKLQVGDVIWRSDSPVKLHRVTKLDNKGKRAKNPILMMVQFDRNAPEKTGEKRHLHRNTLKDDRLEFHQVPGQGPRADRDNAQRDLPIRPKGGWPKFDDVGVSKGKAEKLQQAFRDFKGIRSPAEVTLPKIKERLDKALEGDTSRKALKGFMHELRDWVGELKDLAKDGGEPLKDHLSAYQAMKIKLDQGISQLDGDDRGDRRDRKKTKTRLTPDMDLLPKSMKEQWDEGTRAKMAPLYGKALQHMARGGEIDDAFANNFVKDLKKSGANMDGLRGPVALGALANFASRMGDSSELPGESSNLNQGRLQAAKQARRLSNALKSKVDDSQERRKRREDGPKRHQNRKELRGGGRKQMDADAKLNAHFISLAFPEKVSDDVKAAVTAQLKAASYSDLEKLRSAASKIYKNFDDPRAKETVLVKHLGYDREGLKKLKQLMARKLGDVNGRRYHDDVLEMANKYDLESEDADELYEFRIDKPSRGRALSDQEKMSRFLAKAKPETKERMQGMALADFMVMYNSILQEVLEDDEDLAEAA